MAATASGLETAARLEATARLATACGFDDHAATGVTASIATVEQLREEAFDLCAASGTRVAANRFETTGRFAAASRLANRSANRLATTHRFANRGVAAGIFLAAKQTGQQALLGGAANRFAASRFNDFAATNGFAGVTTRAGTGEQGFQMTESAGILCVAGNQGQGQHSRNEDTTHRDVSMEGGLGGIKHSGQAEGKPSWKANAPKVVDARALNRSVGIARSSPVTVCPVAPGARGDIGWACPSPRINHVELDPKLLFSRERMGCASWSRDSSDPGRIRVFGMT